MRVRSHAKVNLTLEVLGRRADGYHEIRSVFRTLALHDTLHIEAAPGIAVTCSVPELGGEGNLAHRAALILRETTGYSGGARIDIEKRIPVAAGLGGGSSNAAAVLHGLNLLWGTGLDRPALAALAARLGSDVPFFLCGGTALAAGRGELITPLPAPPDCAVALVRPPVAVSTGAVYAVVTPLHYTDGAISARFAALPPDAPPHTWPLTNALQAITSRVYPVVGEAVAALQSWGAIAALMCGSGATCFGLFESPDAAAAAAEQSRERGWDGWATHFA